MTKDEAIKYLQQIYPNGGHCWLDEQRIEAIGMAIQALQEEPKECMYSKDNYTDEDRKVLCDGCEEECEYAQKEEPVSEDLEKAAEEHLPYPCPMWYAGDDSGYENAEREVNKRREAFKAGAQWQKENLWKPADGEDLPEIDREVVVLTQPYSNDEHLRVVFAHRPNPEGWDAKSIITEKVERYIPETYDKGGWNIPDVKWWLDVELPKEIEL